MAHDGQLLYWCAAGREAAFGLPDQARSIPSRTLPVQIELSEAAQMAQFKFVALAEVVLRQGRHARWQPVLIVKDRKSTRLNSSHLKLSRMPSSA